MQKQNKGGPAVQSYVRSQAELRNWGPEGNRKISRTPGRAGLGIQAHTVLHGGRKEQVFHGLEFICVCGGLGRLSEWVVGAVQTARGRSLRTVLLLAGSH